MASHVTFHFCSWKVQQSGKACALEKAWVVRMTWLTPSVDYQKTKCVVFGRDDDVKKALAFLKALTEGRCIATHMHSMLLASVGFNFIAVPLLHWQTSRS